MTSAENGRLRVLICDAPGVRLEEVSRTVAALGHEVIARAASLVDVARTTLMERPDVALVVVRDESDKALALIDEIVHAAACPVIAFLDVENRAFVNEASKRGLSGYIVGADAQEMQSAIDIVLRRFSEYRDLNAAFGRRAVTERAKGILMERHDVDEQTAFTMLRDAARKSNRKIVDVAEAVVSSRGMLPTHTAKHPDP